MTTAEIMLMHEEVKALARERGAVILAHNYQVPEVQDVADYVGDSLGLSRQAAATDADAIVFCGVHFMAKTAKILSPEKTVLIPDPDAGCSLASSITAEQLRQWKAENPGAVVVSYVNTTADVKAETDYCCTSGNAKAVIEAIPRDQEILFLPDMYLGLWLEKVTGRKLNIWLGECHVHAGIRPEDIERWQTEAPDAELLVHPECGCASQAMAFGNERTHILSTEGMINFAKQSSKPRMLVATEIGIIHRLEKEAPGKRFEPVNRNAFCKYMKMITLEKLRDSLRDWKYEVTAGIEPREGTEYAGLVLNLKGYERLRETKLGRVNCTLAATESFNQRNGNMSLDQALTQAMAILGVSELPTTATVSVAFGCPFEGRVDPAHVAALCEQLEADEVVLADTIGVATPTQVKRLVEIVKTHTRAVGVHLHNTRNTGYANALAALEAGATLLDASVGGLGGCPYAPKATGNIATEDLVYLLEGEGVETGVDLDAIVRISEWLEQTLGRRLEGYVYRAGPWAP